MAKPDWVRDELILALDLYTTEPKARGNKSHPAVISLSKILNQLPIHGSGARDTDFRNPNGVGMKLSNFLRFDPEYKGVGLSGGSRLEKEVWNTYANDRELLDKVAVAIRANMTELPPTDVDDEDGGDEEADEGKVLTRTHRRRERSKKLVKKKKDRVLKATGKLACEVCGFDYGKSYGDLGKGFAECHHTVPVSELKPRSKTKLSELAIVCASCHRMIHRKRPWLTLDGLRTVIATGANA